MLILTVQNTSKCAPVSDYEWVAYINQTPIAMGNVYGHMREDGWRKLVQLVAEAEDVMADVFFRMLKDGVKAKKKKDKKRKGKDNGTD